MFDTYLIDVLLSFLPYGIGGLSLLVLALLIEPLTRLALNRPGGNGCRNLRLLLYGAMCAVWSAGAFLALTSPTNIPKRETFDKAASHRALTEQAEQRRNLPKPAVTDDTRKPESAEERRRRFEALTDYKSRTRTESQ
ncbi:MAG: hypothetical protein Kow0065_09210 [Methylomicrobium sp.]